MTARPLPRRRTTPKSALDRATRRLRAEMKAVRAMGWDRWSWIDSGLVPGAPHTEPRDEDGAS